METLMVNYDEYLGEKCVGTREEFRQALQNAFDEWYRDYEGALNFDEFVDDILDSHLRPADSDDIESCQRLGDHA